MEDSLNTAYDDAFRTMIEKCDDLVIPMLNYMFNEHYTGKEQIIRSSNEEFSQQDRGGIRKRITDSQIMIQAADTRKNYHIECESSSKTGSVLVRIFEYGSQIALNDPVVDDEGFRIRVRFPNAGVLLLRGQEKTPDKMTIEIVTPDGGGCSYHVPMMKECDFTLDQIFDRELYLLLPFYMFHYEGRLPEYNKDGQLLMSLLKEYEDITVRLDRLVEADKLSSRSRYVIIQMIKRVSDKLSSDHEQVKQKVGDMMGGHVIDLDIFQAEDRAEARGEARGEDRKLIRQICRKLLKGKSVKEIADDLEEDEVRIKAICDEAQKFAPDYNEEKVIRAIEALETV